MSKTRVTTGRAAIVAICLVSALASGCSSDSSSEPEPSSTPTATAPTSANDTSTASSLPPSSPLTMTTVGGVAVAAPKATPKHDTGNAGELWAWTGGGKNLLALVVAKRHTNVPTQTGVEGSLLTQVEQAKGDLDKPDVTQLEVDVPGAKGSAGTALQGSSKGVPVHQALVMFTDGDQTMYLVRLSVLRTKAGNALADQIVHSLTLAG